MIKSQPNDKGISYVVWFVSLDVCLRKQYVYVCNSSCYLCYNGIKCYKDNVNSVALCGQGCLIATSYYNIWFFMSHGVCCSTVLCFPFLISFFVYSDINQSCFYTSMHD